MNDSAISQAVKDSIHGSVVNSVRVSAQASANDYFKIK